MCWAAQCVMFFPEQAYNYLKTSKKSCKEKCRGGTAPDAWCQGVKCAKVYVDSGHCKKGEENETPKIKDRDTNVDMSIFDTV